MKVKEYKYKGFIYQLKVKVNPSSKYHDIQLVINDGLAEESGFVRKNQLVDVIDEYINLAKRLIDEELAPPTDEILAKLGFEDE